MTFLSIFVKPAPAKAGVIETDYGLPLTAGSACGKIQDTFHSEYLGNIYDPIATMKINPSHIGFDIDGVVADTSEAFIRLAKEDYDIDIRPEELTDFLAEECLTVSPAIIAEIFDRLLKTPLAIDLKPIPHATSVLRELAMTSTLTFITARPDPEPITAWLENHLGAAAFAGAQIVATGDHDGKAPHIRRFGLNYFVDDRHLTCNLLAKEPGITPIVYSQPWNRGRHTLNSVESWQEIRLLCLDREAP